MKLLHWKHKRKRKEKKRIIIKTMGSLRNFSKWEKQLFGKYSNFGFRSSGMPLYTKHNHFFRPFFFEISDSLLRHAELPRLRILRHAGESGGIGYECYICMWCFSYKKNENDEKENEEEKFQFLHFLCTFVILSNTSLRALSLSLKDTIWMP